tara:strand:+ start:11176 stop:11550 length:375 start_codon:yes stop_codon:yes gene_type:complete
MTVIAHFFRGFFLTFIRAYQWLVSPVLPGSCRHLPTCSQYAVEAIDIHGPFHGFWLALKRVLRCNPWGSSGYDPVPPKSPADKGSKITEKSVAEEPMHGYTERANSSNETNSQKFSATHSSGPP